MRRCYGRGTARVMGMAGRGELSTEGRKRQEREVHRAMQPALRIPESSDDVD